MPRYSGISWFKKGSISWFWVLLPPSKDGRSIFISCHLPWLSIGVYRIWVIWLIPCWVLRNWVPRRRHILKFLIILMSLILSGSCSKRSSKEWGVANSPRVSSGILLLFFHLIYFLLFSDRLISCRYEDRRLWSFERKVAWENEGLGFFYELHEGYVFWTWDQAGKGST